MIYRSVATNLGTGPGRLPAGAADPAAGREPGRRGRDPLQHRDDLPRWGRLSEAVTELEPVVELDRAVQHPTWTPTPPRSIKCGRSWQGRSHRRRTAQLRYSTRAVLPRLTRDPLRQMSWSGSWDEPRASGAEDDRHDAGPGTGVCSRRQ
jgi:hypothetical protein